MKDNKLNKEEAVKKPLPKKQRIGVFSEKFIQTTRMSPLIPQTYIKPWKKNELVLDEETLELLLSIGAPIKVYVEDGGIH